MHLNEWDAYQVVVCTPKVTEWDRQQHETFVGSKLKIIESLCPSNTSRLMQKSHNVSHSKSSLPTIPLLYKSSIPRQRNIKDLFKGNSIKETMRHLIRKFFIYESIEPYKASSHHFKNMIIDAKQAGNY